MDVPLMILDSVSFAYGNNNFALRDVSLKIDSGGMYSVIGRNGSGKSTLVKILAGVFSGFGGTVDFLGKPIASYDRKFLARHIACVPQENTLFDFNLSVPEFLSFGRYACKKFSDFRNGIEDRKITDAAMSLLGITGFRSKKLSELSGGEKQKVYIALALVQLDVTSDLRGKLLIVDEPLTFLDVNYQFEIFNVLTKLNDSGLAVLAVTHDLNIAIKYTKNTYLFDKGCLAKSGRTGEIITEESLSEYFMLNSQIVKFENDFHINFFPTSKSGKNGIQ